MTPIVANSTTSVEPIAAKPIRTEEKKSEGVSIEPISSSPVAETSPEAVTDKIYLLPEENTPVIAKISVEAWLLNINIFYVKDRPYESFYRLSENSLKSEKWGFHMNILLFMNSRNLVYPDYF